MWLRGPSPAFQAQRLYSTSVGDNIRLLKLVFLVLQVKELNGRLVNKSITLQLTPAALDFAVSQSYDHMSGARPLRRWLEHHILTDLSRMIVTGELTEGSTVTADAGAGGALRYAVQPQPGPGSGSENKRPRFQLGQNALDIEELDMEE